MTDIHIIHKRVGGVGHIAKLLEQRGKTVLDAKIGMQSYHDRLDVSSMVFFHQPFSHVCCLWYALTSPSKRARLCCVLHEASNYNLGVASLWRALVGTICRFLVIRFCVLLGVKIKGVSDYVCSTYLLKPRRISYTYLFRERLESNNVVGIKKCDFAVFWLRRGDGAYAFQYLAGLQRKASLSSVAILGDPFECDLFTSRLGASGFVNKVKVLELGWKVDEQHFFELLKMAKWFVSTYPREGFGLSAFQAANFGCVVLSQKKGAVREWLPSINHVIAEKLLDTASKLDLNEVNHASQINRKFAQDYLKNEN